MADKVTLGGKSPGSPKPKKDSGTPLGQQVGTPILVVISVVAILGLVAAGFYAYNGGWKTDAQKDEQFKHEIMPIMQAKRGMTEALDRENQIRKQNGQPLLELPKNRHETADAQRQKLMELQQKLSGRLNSSASGN